MKLSFGLAPWLKRAGDAPEPEHIPEPVELIEPTEEEAANSWDAESLTAYLAERALAQSKLSLSMFDRKPPRPRWANHRYSPFHWRAGRAARA